MMRLCVAGPGQCFDRLLDTSGIMRRNAMVFFTLWLQLEGFSDFQASLLYVRLPHWLLFLLCRQKNQQEHRGSRTCTE